MITTPSSLADQILNLAEGIGAEMKALRNDISIDIDGGYITDEVTGESTASTLFTELQALISTASTLKEELSTLGASTVSDIDARLTAIENVDYNGLYGD